MIAVDIDIITALNWIIAFGLPLLVGVITKNMAESLPKVLWLAGLNVVNSGLGELARSLTEGTSWSLGNFLFTLMGALAVAYGAYSNVWKPTGAAAKAQGKTVEGTSEIVREEPITPPQVSGEPVVPTESSIEREPGRHETP